MAALVLSLIPLVVQFLSVRMASLPSASFNARRMFALLPESGGVGEQSLVSTTRVNIDGRT
ncbi:expressed protein [Arabidopsis lyrata subsp. lyrata]|uniref:Expressed protein n=1 Tax=Arabidopsis lyrata subsp. lyrata TaxID=81972 RepID=D7LJH8_ARALL|nr:expressed protein [Arabidopsis lyrata subsp. lyrata]